MATNTGIDFDKLTPPDWAVQSVREIIFRNVLSVDSMGRFSEIMRKQVNGKKLALVGEFGLTGVASEGCSPTYGSTLLDTQEKEWEIDAWQIAEQICYEELRGTLVQESLRSGTAVGDLTGTEYMDKVILPRLELAVYKTVFRLVWFGDKSASLATSGGVLKTGVDPKYFTVTNGFWKRFYDAVTANALRRTTIEANEETTYAEQKSAILAAGVATGIMDTIIMDAPQRLRQSSSQMILITQALKDALDYDIRNNNKGSELQWEAIFNGIRRANYNGVDVYAMPLWDEMIQNYEGQYTESDMTAWNKPYRAIYTSKDNLLIGTESENEIADLDIIFDRKERMNYLYATDTIGTLIKDDDMFQVAY